MESWVDGGKIAELRKQQGLGIRELASKAHIDHSILSRLERDLQEDCKLSIIASIASVLGVKVDDLLRHGQRTTNHSLVPELQAVNNELAKRSTEIQQQAAGILRGYLSTLDVG